MDLRDDSYFLLERNAEAGFLKHLADIDGARLTTTEMIIVADPGEDLGAVAVALCERPRRSLIGQAGTLVRPRPADLISVALTLRRTRWSLKRRPIAALLADLGSTEEGCMEQLEPLVDRARRFLAARPLVPFRANCLLDSLALLSWLGPGRQGAMLVFGVKLDPFAAHCWVQTADLLINDRADNVERFEPVRVLKCSAVTR